MAEKEQLEYFTVPQLRASLSDPLKLVTKQHPPVKDTGNIL